MQEITIGISLAIADIDPCIPPMVVYCPTWIPTVEPLLLNYQVRNHTNKSSKI
jgi:hypothetical protein